VNSRTRTTAGNRLFNIFIISEVLADGNKIILYKTYKSNILLSFK